MVFSTLYATSTTEKFAVARQSLPGSTLILRLVMAFSTHTKRSVDSKQARKPEMSEAEGSHRA